MTRLVSGCVTVRELNFSHFVFSLTPASPRGSHVSPSQRYQQEQGKPERNNDQDRRRLRVLLRRPSLRCKIPTFHSGVAFPSRHALRADGFGIGGSTYLRPLRKRTPGPPPNSAMNSTRQQIIPNLSTQIFVCIGKYLRAQLTQPPTIPEQISGRSAA